MMPLLLLTVLAALQEAPRIPLRVADDARIELEARWEPCRRSKYGLFEETAVLRQPRVAAERREYSAAEIAAFMPPDGAPLAVGDTWAVAKEAVLPFLRQLHPGARAELHHGFGAYEGAFACLRAASETHAEVLFRAHAELLLEGGVTYTPAQFEGRLVLERASGRPLFLSIALPDRDTNVDVNVPGPEGSGSFHADIGWVPRMEVASAALDEEPRWATGTSSIPLADARTRLARSFYPFARIDWLPFPEAVAAARELDRPLHVVVLFGALDDESC